jgi:hypothetical protein
MNFLLSCLLFLFNLLLVNKNRASFRDRVSFERMSLVIFSSIVCGLASFKHFCFVALPEIERGLILFSDFDAILLHSQASVLISLLDGVVARLKDLWRDWLATEALLASDFLLNPLLLLLLLIFALSDGLVASFVTQVKSKRLGHGDAVLTLFAVIMTNIILSSQSSLLLRLCSPQTCAHQIIILVLTVKLGNRFLKLLFALFFSSFLLRIIIVALGLASFVAARNFTFGLAHVESFKIFVLL